MNSIILKILKVLYRYNVACKNLGIINTLKILKARFNKKEYLVKLETKLFGNIYWRSVVDYGVISHFFSPQVTFNKINSNKKIIIDLGANIGIETLRFNYLFPSSKIISVEPDTENFKILEKNTYDFKNIIVLNNGIWNEDSFLKIKYKSIDNSQKISFVKASSSDQSVKSITISNIIKQYSLSKIDIMKIDLEGTEEIIFDRTCDDWLAFVEIFIIECPDNDIPFVTQKIFEAFRRNNLNFKTSISGENLIFIKEGCEALPNQIELY